MTIKPRENIPETKQPALEGHHFTAHCWNAIIFILYECVSPTTMCPTYHSLLSGWNKDQWIWSATYNFAEFFTFFFF